MDVLNLHAPSTGNIEGSKELTVLYARPMQILLPGSITYTPLGNRPVHLLIIPLRMKSQVVAKDTSTPGVLVPLRQTKQRTALIGAEYFTFILT